MRKGKHQHNFHRLIYSVVFQLLEMKILWAKVTICCASLKHKSPLKDRVLKPAHGGCDETYSRVILHLQVAFQVCFSLNHR